MWRDDVLAVAWQTVTPQRRCGPPAAPGRAPGAWTVRRAIGGLTPLASSGCDRGGELVTLLVEAQQRRAVCSPAFPTSSTPPRGGGGALPPPKRARSKAMPDKPPETLTLEGPCGFQLPFPENGMKNVQGR